jgi:hypothetical protein
MAWRPVALLIAAALVAPASASAVTNQVTPAGTFTGGVLDWTMHTSTVPAGSQPDTITAITMLLPQEAIFDGASLPTCAQGQIDGAQSVPQTCIDATFATGTATIYAGSPGAPMANSVREDLDVRVINGSPAGSALLLVLSSTPAAPVAITNRVVPATVGPTDAPYATAVKFSVPSDLQSQLGLSLVLTDLRMTFNSIKLFHLSSCSGSLPVRQLTEFKALGGSLSTVANDANVPCDSAATPAPVTTPPLETEPTLNVFVKAGSLRRVKPDRRGGVTVPGASAECPAGSTGPCTVTAVLKSKRLKIGSSTFHVGAGKTGAIMVRLSRAGRRLLAKKGKLPAAADLEIVTPAGKSARMIVQLTLAKRR